MECIDEMQKLNPALFEPPKERELRKCVDLCYPLCASIMAQQFERFHFDDDDDEAAGISVEFFGGIVVIVMILFM
jgi:hypothetical protein